MLELKWMVLSVLLVVNGVPADPLNVNIDVNGILWGFNMTEIPTDLDLSGLGIRDIGPDVPPSLLHVRSLNLGNNMIARFPESFFSSLVNLQNLSLANNSLTDTRNVFSGLGNLTYLDLSDNPLQETLDDNCFFGLSPSCDVITKGVTGIKKIGSNAFGNETLISNSTDTDKDLMTLYLEQLEREISARRGLSRPKRSIRLMVCGTDNSVQRISHLDPEAEVPSGCKTARRSGSRLILQNFGITRLENGWMGRNPSDETVRVTRDAKMDIAENVTWLDLRGNHIKRLEKGTIVHPNIFSVELEDNEISQIEHWSFELPKLHQLLLGNNRLTDTGFAATLPAGLVSLHLDHNEISDIKPNSFCHLKSLSYLTLEYNKLTAIECHCLRGASHISQLILRGNEIATIEPGSFDGIGAWQVFLQENKIQHLEKGVFKGDSNITQLQLENNHLTKIEKDIFDLPRLQHLDLGDNNITTIDKGALKKLTKLEHFHLSRNPIKRLDNGALFGLNKSGHAHVHVDGIPIEVIQGGVFDNV